MPHFQTSSTLDILVPVSILISRLSISLIVSILSLGLPILISFSLSLWLRGIRWVLELHLLWFRGLHHSVPVTTCLVVWISLSGHCTGSGDGMRSCSLGMSIRECSGIRVCCIRIFSILENGILKWCGIHIRYGILI